MSPETHTRLEVVQGLVVPGKDFDLYDTTLRDGQQGIDVAFSVRGKLRVARKITETLPVTHIEGGWPGANPTDTEFFRRAQDESFHSILTAFGMTRRANINVEDDEVLKDLLKSNAPFITFVGKTDILHVTNVFRIDPEENLRMIYDSIKFAKEQGRRVIYDAEHFFDGADRDEDYAMQTLYAAAQGGAETIVLCDTNGGKFPWEVEGLVRRVINDANLHKLHQEAIGTSDPTKKMKIGIHTHSDRKNGEANALYAVRAGATHVQGTVAGIGERAGNADLLVLTDDLADMGHITITPEQQRRFVELGNTLNDAAGIEHNPNQPLIGEYVFGTKAGMHQDAQIKFRDAYAFKRPEVFGNSPAIFISNQSGRRAVLERMNQLGIPTTDKTIKTILQEIKDKEDQGYRFVKGSASLELLLRRHDPSYQVPFSMRTVQYDQARFIKVTLPNKEDSGQMRNIEIETTPMHPPDIFEQLKSILEAQIPELSNVYFGGYQLQRDNGTVRIFSRASNGSTTWTSVGIGHDILSAGWEAVSDALEYPLLHLKSRSE